MQLTWNYIGCEIKHIFLAEFLQGGGVNMPRPYLILIMLNLAGSPAAACNRVGPGLF